MRVHTSVRRSVLQPISRMRVLGQKSWISAFHCKQMKQLVMEKRVVYEENWLCCVKRQKIIKIT